MARDAITHDDSGTKRVPTSDGEWDEWVPASAVRNYVLGDPLLDWLDRHGESKGFTRDEPDARTDFLGLIFRKGAEFERSVVEHLRGLGVGDVRTLGAADSQRGVSRDLDMAFATWDAMVDGVALIDQGVLRDPEHRCYGLPDLLVRSDVLSKLFPDDMSPAEASVGAPALDIGDCHYVVVDIKYTTMNLSADGGLLNSGSVAAYKAQLHVYNRALGRLQGYLAPWAFLLGRSWKQKIRGETTRGGDCTSRLGPVEHDEAIPGGSLSQQADAAADWICRMRSHGSGWDVLPVPTVEELRPNANGDPGRWTSAVRSIVTQGSDLTVLHNVGVKARREANAKKLTDWRDPQVTSESLGVKGTHKVRQLTALLDVNRTPGPAVRPAHIGAARSEWIDVPPLEFYVDFETVNDIGDDFSAIPNRGGQPLVFMVGCGHLEDTEWRFECFVADQLTEPAEAVMIEQWLNHMDTVRDRLDPGSHPKVIHWSGHEVSSLTTAFNAAVKRHRSRASRWPVPRWFDFLQQVINKEPVVVKGAHGFGLKAITNAMHAQGLVKTRWQTGPADGLGAMVGAWWCQHEIDEGRADRLVDLELMGEIRDYNQVDCEAMMQIVRYLRDHH